MDAHNDVRRTHGISTLTPAPTRARHMSRNSGHQPRDIARPTRALMHIHVRPGAVGRHMQKESTRTDQTRARNAYGTCPILTGQGIQNDQVGSSLPHLAAPPTPPPSSPLSGPHALFTARPAHHACGGGCCCALCDESASSSRCHAQSSSPSPPSPSSPASASVRASFARHVFPQPDSNAPSSSAHLAYVALMPPNSFLYYSPNKTLHRKTLTPSPRSGPSDGSPKSSRSFPKGVTL